jgi:hypothetical protein
MRDGRRVAVGRPADLVRPFADRVVRVHGGEPERVIAAVRAMPEVASTTQLGDTVHVLLATGAPPAAGALPLIERRLAAAGIGPTRCEPATPNLEDVFVAALLGEDLAGRGAERPS